ncbi:MAG: hypothetical protein AAFX02_10800 [Pseudomonadota bacterium]
MSRSFHKFWLKISAIVVGSFGPIFFLGTMDATLEPARWTLDLLSWPLDGATTLADSDARFIIALAGGFLTGWGVMIWCLSQWLHDVAPEAVRKTLLLSALSWYVIDSSGSIASGNAYNAGFNLIILLLVVGPMWRPAQEDRIAA